MRNNCLFFSASLLVFLATGLSAFAQYDGSIRGHLQDTVSSVPVPDATITVLDAKDSSLVSFSRSLPSGRFRIPALNRGIYRLLVTHIGYRSTSRIFMITDLIRDPDLGLIVLTSKASLLDSVTVEQAAVPVTIRHDTIEFNAGSNPTRS
jgi:hypothetical protein